MIGVVVMCYIGLCRFSEDHLEQVAISQFTGNSTKKQRVTVLLTTVDETVTLGFPTSGGRDCLAIRQTCYLPTRFGGLVADV